MLLYGVAAYQKSDGQKEPLHTQRNLDILKVVVAGRLTQFNLSAHLFMPSSIGWDHNKYNTESLTGLLFFEP